MFLIDKKGPVWYIKISQQCADGRKRYSTGITTEPNNWDQETGRILKDRNHLNQTLIQIEKAVKAFKKDLALYGKPLTREGLTNMLDKLLGRNQHASGWVEAIEKIIKDRENGSVLTGAGKKFSPHTIKGYRHSLDNLIKFSKMTRTDLAFDKITLQTYEKLIAYFNTHHDHALNSLGKTVKNWKVFLKAAHKAGHHENLIYDHEDFKVPGEETEDIYLSEAELEKIYKHNLINKTLDFVRDWFILDCYSGLRICDIQVLTKKNIVDGYIRLANEKTDIAVMVPFHPYVRAIIKKWDGLPPKISDQKLNQYIKQVAELAGIKGTVLYSVTKGGQRKDYYLNKWEMVSNHTARRSFITNLLKAGIPHTQVMRLAGIKKLTTLQRYDKQTVQEVAESMKGHDFFKNKSKGKLKAV